MKWVFLVYILILFDKTCRLDLVGVVDLDNKFDDDDPEAIIFIRLLTWYIKFEKRKALEKR